MSTLEVHDLRAGYGHTEVLHGVSLTVAEGRTTAVLGDSGSGKTTLLRAVAGFLRPTGGQVTIGSRVVSSGRTWVAPERRGIGYVRQEGGLFPHLSVAGNISFGLPRPGWSRRERGHRDRVLELLELVELPAELAERRPAELSGGQQQRVALARALAPEPALVLLDEPFSSLDTGLRASTREATARALRASGATVVLVTHDQSEALSFADEIAVLRSGQVRQVAEPRTIYGEPADPQVATFMGDAVLLAGETAGQQVRCAIGLLPVVGFIPRGQVDVLLRPEQLRLTQPGQGLADGYVSRVDFYGHDALVTLQLARVDPEFSESTTAILARVRGHQTPEVGQLVGLDLVNPVRVFSR
ncbi:ABC transporter ATP-binding protein [Propionibacteriaceae bacterium Y1923]|uniref:ABC transporter ATP-binding protein n=1 Tax=Aestuariimicrobium sp. Y1814 TaxID=3418742 RepID=UPI003C22974B